MNAVRSHKLTAAVAVLVLVGAVVGSAVAIQPAVASQSAATHAAAIGFAPTTVVDDQRLSGEPDIKVCGVSASWSYGSCGANDPFISVPWGFSTTSSFIWRSEDQGRTFKLVPSNDSTGKPTLCPGGGDTDLGVFPGKTVDQDRVNFEDLQGLTNFSAGVSTDGGTTFTCNPVSAAATAVDRQWFGFHKNPGATGSTVYLDYDIANGGTVYPTCASVAGSAGNVFVVQASTDGGLVYGPATPVDCNDGIAGNMQVNQKNGHVFAIHTAYANPATCSNGTDAVVVNKSVDGGVTWTKSVVFKPAKLTSTCGNDVTTGQDFAVLAIDKSGGLYAVWSQAPTNTSGAITGPSHIYYSYSGDEGKTWSPEQQVDKKATTNLDVFPWIAAGDKGRIDVVWYGTNAGGKGPWDPGSQTTSWYPYLSQSLNANRTAAKGATFSAPVKVSQYSNHNGGICTMGLGCTTGGDRSLVDFFQVDVNKSGGAEVVWASTSDNSGSGANQAAVIETAQQNTGPGLFKNSKVQGPHGSTCTQAAGVPCQTDVTGDAKYEALGTIGSNVPNMDITGSSIGIDPNNAKNLKVRMSVASLAALPSTGETGLNANNVYVDYLTSWVYHNPKGTQATYDSTGNTYYAYLEVNTATGTTTAYAGNTCSISTTHGKYLTYPGDVAATSTIDKVNGVVTLTFPLTAVGNPPVGAKLYSVTAHTVGQAGPAGGPGSCTRDPNGNNQDPTGQIFDVYDKSPAYTAQLMAPLHLVITGSGHQSGHVVTLKWTLVSGPRPNGFNLLTVSQNGTVKKINKGLVPSHSSKTYSLVVRHVTSDIDTFFVQAEFNSAMFSAGPFPVSG